MCDIKQRTEGKISLFNHVIIKNNNVLPTISAGGPLFRRADHPYHIHEKELITASSFPQDFNFGNEKVQYVTGMSVPPVMIAQIAMKIKNQWFN